MAKTCGWLLLVIFGLYSLPAGASFYLASKNKDFRCEYIGQWTGRIADEIFEGAIPVSPDDTFAARAAVGFSDPLFSRAFGRGFDDLTRAHRKQIAKDLRRCKTVPDEVAKQLAVPFSGRSALRSEEGRRWLVGIYTAYASKFGKNIQSGVDKTFDTIEYGCRPGALSNELDAAFFDAKRVDELNGILGPLIRAHNVEGGSIEPLIARRIKDIDYTIGRIEAGQGRFVDRDIYLDVLRSERGELQSHLQPADWPEIVARYVAAAAALIGESGSKVAAFPESFGAYDEIASFHQRFQANFQLKCIDRNSTLRKYEVSTESTPELVLAMEDFTAAVESKLVEIASRFMGEFQNEISVLDNDIAFRNFARIRLASMSLSVSVMHETGIAKAYFDQKTRYEEWKKEVARLMAELDENIREKASISFLLGVDGWGRAPNQPSKAMQIDSIGRFISAMVMTEGDLTRLPEARDTVVMAVHNTDVGSSKIQLQLSCDSQDTEQTMRLVAIWTGGTLKSADESSVESRYFSSAAPEGVETTLPIVREGRTNYVNSVRVSLPSAGVAWVQYEIPLPNTPHTYRTPRIYGEKGAVRMMRDICFPSITREAITTMPTFLGR